MSDTTYKITGSFSGDQAIIAAYRNIEAAIKQVTEANKALQKASQISPGIKEESSRRVRQHKEEASAIMKVAEAAHRYRMIMRETRDIVRDSMEGFAPYKEGAETLARAEMRFRTLNLSASENAAAFGLVNEIAKKNKNTYSDLTDELQNLHTAFGDIHHAMEFLPDAARTEYISSALFGTNPKETQANILSSMKALEQMGALRATGPKDEKGQATVTKTDMDRLHEYYDTVVKMQVMTKGVISGQELQQFVAAGGVAAKQLSPEGLRNMTFIIQEMKGARAGTGLMAMFQSFRAFRQGAGGQRSFENLAALGLTKSPAQLQKEGLAEFTKEGRIKKLKPGAVPVADLLAEDPIQFALAINEALVKNGDKVFGTGAHRKKFDVKNTSDVALALSQITGSKTSMNELATMILQIAQIQKDSGNVLKTLSAKDIEKMVDESPIGQMKKWETAVENFRQKAGLPLINMLGSFFEKAQPFLEFLAEHPKMAFFTIAGFKMVGMFIELLSVLKQFQMMNKIINIMPAVTPGSSGIAQNAGRSLGSSITTGIGIALASFTIERFVNQWMDVAEKQVQMRQGKEAVKDIDKQIAEISKQEDEGKISGADATAARRELLGQAGAAKVKSSGALGKGGFLELDSEFAKLVALSAHGRMGGANASDFVGIANPLWGLANQLRFGMKYKDATHPEDKLKENITGMGFRSQSEVQKFLDTIRQSGIYTEQEFGVIEKVTNEAYPSFASATQEATHAITDMTKAAADFTTTLSSLQPTVGGIPVGTSEPVPALEPGHAKGGFTRKDHRAMVHKDEFIIPESKAKEYFAAATGGGGGLPPINMIVNMPITAHPGTDMASITKAAYAGLQKGKRELERTLNIMIDDRRLGGNG